MFEKSLLKIVVLAVLLFSGIILGNAREYWRSIGEHEAGQD